MKIEKQSVEHYLQLPYTITLKRDEDGDIVGKIQELDGCIAHGSTESKALAALKNVQAAWLLDCIESGQPVPVPADSDDDLPSGRWVQRVPRSLHKNLTKMAKREKVSLNQLVTAMLSESYSTKSALDQITETVTTLITRHSPYRTL